MSGFDMCVFAHLLLDLAISHCRDQIARRSAARAIFGTKIADRDRNSLANWIVTLGSQHVLLSWTLGNRSDFWLRLVFNSGTARSARFQCTQLLMIHSS